MLYHIEMNCPTQQQTFDTVVTHLRKQGCKSLGDDGNCAYRSPEGYKCAAGCLIPDNRYCKAMENRPVMALLHIIHDKTFPTYVIEQEGHDLPLVRSLQLVHDCNPIELWERELDIIARQYGLTYAAAVA